MEGTRHERVALVVAAYVIGFITAFIAFGIGGQKDVEMKNKQAGIHNAAAQTIVSEQNPVSVGIGEDGLFVITDTGERMLSASQQSLNASLISSAGVPGMYYSIIDAEASHNGVHVYFCEQLTADSETCDPYVYSLQTDLIYPVKIDGEKYRAPITTHKSTLDADAG